MLACRATMGRTQIARGANKINEYAFRSSMLQTSVAARTKAHAANVVRSVKSVPPLPTVANARYPPKAPITVPRIAALLSYLGTLEY